MSVAIQIDELPDDSADLYQWYQAESSLGAVSLGIAVDRNDGSVLTGPHRVLRQGLLLAEVELVVQAIELWLECELDLVPQDVATGVSIDSPVAMLDAVIQPVASINLPNVCLRIPFSSVELIKSVDAVLTDQLEFKWSPLRLNLRFAEMSLNHMEFSDLEMGSLVLLPESFQSSWIVKGSFPASVSLQMAANLNPVSLQFEHTRFVSEKAQTTDSVQDVTNAAMHPVCIQPERRCEIDPGELFGFPASGVTIIPDLEQSDLVLCCREQIVGRGRLVRVGRGFGFVLLETGG